MGLNSKRNHYDFDVTLLLFSKILISMCSFLLKFEVPFLLDINV